MAHSAAGRYRVGETWRPAIPWAIDRDGRSWRPTDLERGVRVVQRGDLRCKGCRVEITWQSPYTIDRPDGRIIDHRLIFKLMPGRQHGPGCPYDFDNRAGDILRSSRAVMRKRGDIYQLRLPLSSLPERAPEAGERRPAPDLGDGLGQVLSAAARVVALLRTFDADGRAAERFEAEYAGQTIIWGDFCWHVGHPADARALVLELRRPERIAYPIAVWGMARPVSRTARGTEYVTIGHPHGLQTAARIRARDPRVLEGVTAALEEAREPGTVVNVMGYGEWRAAALDPPRGSARVGSRAENVEARLWANHPSAVLGFTL